MTSRSLEGPTRALSRLTTLSEHLDSGLCPADGRFRDKSP